MTTKDQYPKQLSEYAKVCLKALSENGLGEIISLGGAVGLMHFLDYRPTNDVDAWWCESAGEEDRKKVLDTVSQALQPFGKVEIRSWGDVISIECEVKGKTVFSFQIALRSIRLEPPLIAPWTDVLVDSLDDLVASKMSTLVERGAPRDFRDVYALCHSDLVLPERCWALWRKRQEGMKSDVDGFRAKTAIQTHLSRIEQHRPLESIENPDQRLESQRLRHWFNDVFLNAIEA